MIVIEKKKLHDIRYLVVLYNLTQTIEYFTKNSKHLHYHPGGGREESFKYMTVWKVKEGVTNTSSESKVDLV